MDRELPGGFYNYTLAAVAIGYVVLLVVLMRGGPDPKMTTTSAPAPGSYAPAPGPGSRSPSSLALSAAVSSAAGMGLRPATGARSSNCTLSGGGSLCVVSGFTRPQGVGSCSITVDVSGVSGDATVRSFRCQ